MRTCSVTGCHRAPRARGLCDSHYQRHRRGLPVEAPLRSYGANGCSVTGCRRPHAARGLCYRHWKENRNPPRWRQRTPAEVQAMRQMHTQGTSFEELARRFGCSASTAARICKGWSFPRE
jgi:AraC-like DNA-binding protein